MDFTVYQKFAEEYALYPGVGNNPEYPTLGLTGEAGEIANKVKKLQRDNLVPEEIRDDIRDELGDVLWYVAALASEFDLDLDDVARGNLVKLSARKARGMIQGSGDYR